MEDKGLLYRGERKTAAIVQLLLDHQCRKVLDVGCASGYLGASLKEKNPTIIVDGVDASAAAIEKAKANYQKTVVGNLNEPEVIAEQFESDYDAVIFADVLEHTLDPLKVLTLFSQKGKKGSTIIISLPNVGFLPVRLKSLVGKFEYEKSGILDDSHLHFYTHKAAKKLLADAYLIIEKEVYFPARLPCFLWPQGMAITFLMVAHQR